MNPCYAFGKVKVFGGGDGGKYPYCNTLLITDEQKAIVDPGCSFRNLKKLADKTPVDTVVLTHYHEDHTRCTSVFEGARVIIHPRDLPGARSVAGLMECYGASDELDGNIWLNFLVHGLHMRDLPQVEPFPGETLDFGKTQATVVPTPGHTPGHVGLLFAQHGVYFSADIDLDNFGPYYGDAVSSLRDMLASIDTVLEIAPDVLITSHTAGVVTRDIRSRLLAYREIIFSREERIRKALKSPRSLQGLCKKHIIYRKQFEPKTIFNLIERNMIREHLIRLIGDGRVEQIGNDLFLAV